METTDSKMDRLRSILAKMGSAVIGYSGGCDSTLLAAVGKEVLGHRAVCVLAVSEIHPAGEIAEALNTAAKLGLFVVPIETHELKNEAFLANSPDHCYVCKKELFGRLAAIAREREIPWIADGSNVDDLDDYRPGGRAADEYAVRSPLCEAGLTKAEIREWSRRLGLPTWDKPAMACLASRIPYGIRIEPTLLKRLDSAEQFLRGMGFRQVRIRHHGTIARIEVEPEEICRLAFPEVRRQVAEKLKDLGYLYPVLDLDGYRTGSLNAVMKQKGNLSRT